MSDASSRDDGPSFGPPGRPVGRPVGGPPGHPVGPTVGRPVGHPRPLEDGVVARGDSGHGEVALRRRGTVLELVVDGVFAMDSTHPDTEIALAGLALDRLAAHRPPADGAGISRPPADGAGTSRPPADGQAGRDAVGSDAVGSDDGAGQRGWRVLVGGLGLGFTAAAVLADPRVAQLVVVELQPLLVEWVRDGLVPSAAGLLADPRVRVAVGDVGQVVGGLPEAGLDAVLLDVDNGPAFLVHEHNAALYRPAFLGAAVRTLAPGGVLAIWSADPAQSLLTALREAGADHAEEVLFDVERDGRRFSYAVYLAGRPS